MSRNRLGTRKRRENGKVAEKVGSSHWGEKKEPKIKELVYSTEIKTRKQRGWQDAKRFKCCPGCHSDLGNVMRFRDNYHDWPGDFWFHCKVCGEEGCVDYYNDNTMDGKKPRAKTPPFHDENPLPDPLPWSGTPVHIRRYIEEHNEKLRKFFKEEAEKEKNKVKQKRFVRNIWE